jgi:hypothetical protein
MNFTKESANPIFWIGILLLAVMGYVYYMNEGYVDASGNKNIDASGGNITLSLSDLIKALSFSNKTGSPNDVLNPPVFAESTNILPVPVTGGKTTLDSETEKRLSKNIATQIKDELLAQRSTTPVIPASGCSESGNKCSDGCESDSCSQGSDYLNNSPGAPFNSNDYIRKDSIPCWGCTLPQ